MFTEPETNRCLFKIATDDFQETKKKTIKTLIAIQHKHHHIFLDVDGKQQ